MGGQKRKSTQPDDSAEFDCLLFPHGVVSSPASKTIQRLQSLVHSWQGDDLWFEFFSSSLFSVAFYPLPSLTSLPTTLGMGTGAGEMIKPGGRWYLWSHVLLYKSFLWYMRMELFPQSGFAVFRFFKTIIHGHSWRPLLCLPAPQKHSNALDWPRVSSETVVDLFTPSILEIMHSILPHCRHAM